jgi:NAD-dependent dihydropyrimidine dehydrogenase PreA subunit
MRPYISAERCKQCGECVTICPYEVFREEDGTIVVLFPEECIECNECVRSCPCEAVTMGD